MTERHLLIVAHGSRRQASNEEVRALGARVSELHDSGRVEVAFLELAEPGIPEGLARCAALGAQEIVVFPYFLAAGTHVAQDIPEALATFRAAHPEIEVRLARHLGAAPELANIILAVASSAD